LINGEEPHLDNSTAYLACRPNACLPNVICQNVICQNVVGLMPKTYRHWAKYHHPKVVNQMSSTDCSWSNVTYQMSVDQLPDGQMPSAKCCKSAKCYQLHGISEISYAKCH